MDASGTSPIAPRIYMYEPAPALTQPLRQLVERFGLNDTIYFGNEVFGGVADAKVMFPQCAQDREDCGIDSAGFDKTQLNMTTVDREFEKNSWGHIDFLSIDTEGNDYVVLMQGSLFLCVCKYCVVILNIKKKKRFQACSFKAVGECRLF